MSNRAAQIRAENSDKTVTRRGRSFIEFDLGGGKRRFVSTIEPLHYGASADTEIDTTWQPDTGAWQYKLLTNSFQLHARNVLNAGDTVQWLDPESGQTVTLQPLALNWVNNANDSRQQITQPQAVTAQADDCTLYWPNGYGTGRHFRFTAHPKRLVKEFIIDAAANLPTPTVVNPYLEVEFILKHSKGVTLYVNGAAWGRTTKVTTANSIEFRVNATGKTAWWFSAPTATDATGENRTPGLLQLRRSGATRYVTVRFPKAWIDAAVFPIVLDPTLTLDEGEAGANTDSSIMSGLPNHNTGINVQFGAGKRNHVATLYRALLKFDLSSIPATATVDTATLTLTVTANNATIASTLSAYRMIRAWVEGTKEYTDSGADGATWNTYDGANAWGTAGANNTTTDREAAAFGSRSNSDAESGALAMSLTAAKVEEWVDGTLTNNGLLLKTGEGDYDQYFYASSDNTTAASRPKIVVEYTEAGGGTEYDQSASGAQTNTGAVVRRTGKVIAGTI